MAIVSGADPEAFLGTQGYIWDTQSDMAFALFGAISALLVFRTVQNRQIEKLSKA